MTLLVCPFHSDEDVAGVYVSNEVGEVFRCGRTAGHPQPGPYEWLKAPAEPELPEMSGLAAELGLAAALPAVLAGFQGRWVEYGVLEHAYAAAHPDDFEFLVDRYSHTAVAATHYSASAFLAGALGVLHRRGEVLLRMAPATGRWHYNSQISWWAMAPAQDWQGRLSWETTGLSMDYVPGSTE